MSGMSLSKIQEQIKKNDEEIASKKKKAAELREKVALQVSKLVIDSGILETGISEKELSEELKNITTRFQTNSEKKSA